MTDTAEMNGDDDEQLLRFLADLQNLVRAEHLSAEERLAAIDGALTMAIGGQTNDARDFVDRMLLRGIDEGGDDNSPG